MATTNYSFTTISDTQKIDIVSALNTPLNQIDTAIKNVADSIPSADSIKQEVLSSLTKGSTYGELKNNGFLYKAGE